MHELSIAQEIIEIVQQYLPADNNESVKTVIVKVGKLSNVLPDSLGFCFEALTTDTPLKGASLEIQQIPVQIHCAQCNTDAEIEPPIFLCPNCSSTDIKIISGTELRVAEIELNEENQEVI